MTQMKNLSDRTAFSLIGVFSLSIVSFLIWLIYINDYHGEIPEWTFNLSGYNAIFNSLSALCLISGYIAIRNQKIKVHLSFMGMAVLFSIGFLISYVMYHHFHGDTKFLGEGWVRILYFFILISHIILSVCIVPLILITLFFTITIRFAQHRKIARITLPLWLYVSVTGVMVYFFLKAYS